MNLTRRQMLGIAGGGISLAALSGVIGSALFGGSSPVEDGIKADVGSLLRPSGVTPASDVKGYLAQAYSGRMSLLSTAMPPVEVKSTPVPVRLLYALVDASVVPEGMTFNEMWDDVTIGPIGHIAQYTTYGMLMDVGDPEYYLLFGDPTIFNSFGGSVNYVAFATDNDYGDVWDDCTYDYDTGIAYIPKSRYTDADGNGKFAALRVQFMIRVDSNSNLENTVPVHIFCDDPRINVADTASVTSYGHTLETIVPVCDAESVEALREDQIDVYISNCDFCQNLVNELFYIDDEGTLHIQRMGLTLPGIEVVISGKGALANPLGARVAYALDDWNDMRIWPWGYVKYKNALVTYCNNKTILCYDGNHDQVTAVDSSSWDEHSVVKAYIKAHFDELLPYTYNIHFMTGVEGSGHPNIDLDTAATSTILDAMYQYSSQDGMARPNIYGKKWSEVEHFIADDRNFADVWTHWLMLPSCDIVLRYWTNGHDPSDSNTTFDADYWKSIKNVTFDNDLIGTEDEDKAQYLSCVLAHAICIHSEADTSDINLSPGGVYIGPIYTRVLHVDRFGAPPTVVIAFHSDGFGYNGKGQAAQCILRFRLDTGNLAISKVAQGSNFDKDHQFYFDVTLTDDEDHRLSGKYGTHTFTNGVCTVHCSVNSSPVEITGLPVGSHYTVVEHEDEDYKFVSKTNDTGTIKNNFRTTTSTWKNKRNLGSLKVVKRTSGNGSERETDRRFHFRVTFRGTDAPDNTDFYLRAGEEEEISGIPLGVVANVSEDSDDLYDVSWSRTPTGIVIENTEGVTLTANNTHEVGKLEIVKKGSGSQFDPNHQFYFDVTLRDTKNNLVSATYGGHTFTNGVCTVHCSLNSSPVIFDELPSGYGYQVVERADADYDMISKVNDTGTIPINGAKVTTTWTNERKLGYATIEKKLSF